MRKRMVSLSFVLLVFAFAVPGPGGPPREAAFVVGQSTYVAGGRVRHADAVPFLEGGRVFVPVRHLAYALGISEGDIKWAGDSGAVSLKLGRTLVQLSVGSRILRVNGEPKEMDAAPVLKAGRVFVPARFVAEAFGFEVNWDGASGALLVGRSPGARAQGAVFDVAVVGAEPEGIAAAVSAARQGVSVLLVDGRDKLGGLYTLGWLNYIDMNHGPGGELVTRGTFLEFYRQVGSASFDLKKAEEVFDRMVAGHPNISVCLNAKVTEALVRDGAVTGLRIQKGGQVFTVRARRVIDATQDGDVTVMAGAPHTVGAEDMGEPGRRQCATLIFRLRGVSWDRLKEAAGRGLVQGTVSGRCAWGFREVAEKYCPSHPRLRLRPLNIGLQSDGTVLVNALQVFFVDGLDPRSKAEGRELALKELPLVAAHLRKHLPGFEEAALDGAAPELYVRETRHIRCLYQLDINDVVFNRDFPDRIAIGSYPVDVQATSPGEGCRVYGTPAMYAVPLRSLVPQKVDNLLVVGRSAGYTHLAAGSARVVPVGMAEGDAAGVAAAYSLKINKSIHALAADEEAVREVQRILAKQGAYLEPVRVPNPLAGHWAFPALEFVNRWGLICAGYENDWGLEKPVGKAAMYGMVADAVRRALPARYRRCVLEKDYCGEEPVKRGETARLLLWWLEGCAPDDPREAVRVAREKGLLPAQHAGVDPEQPITGAEAYYGIHRLCLALGVPPTRR